MRRERTHELCIVQHVIHTAVARDQTVRRLFVEHRLPLASRILLRISCKEVAESAHERRACILSSGIV